MASAGQWNWERMRPAWDPVALDAASPGLPQQGPGEGSASSRGFSGLCQTPPCLPPPRWLGPFPEFLLGSGLSSCGVALGRPPHFRPLEGGAGRGGMGRALDPTLSSWSQTLGAKAAAGGRGLGLSGPNVDRQASWPLRVTRGVGVGTGLPARGLELQGSPSPPLRPAWETCVREGT